MINFMIRDAVISARNSLNEAIDLSDHDNKDVHDKQVLDLIQDSIALLTSTMTFADLSNRQPEEEEEDPCK